jgi:hypothetical protein
VREAVVRAAHELTRGVVSLDDEDDAVRLARDDGGVRHGERGRRVEQHEVEALAEPPERVTHARRADQLGGIRGQRAGREEREPGRVDALDHPVQVVGLAGEEAGEPGDVVDPEDAVAARMAQVGLDEQHPRAGLGRARRRG